jgi:hypothetical protein
MCHTALMLLISMPLRVLNSIVGYDRSKRGLKSMHLIVDGLFVASQNFHSIWIVVLLHASKFSRVLKKLTAYWQASGLGQSHVNCSTNRPECSIPKMVFQILPGNSFELVGTCGQLRYHINSNDITSDQIPSGHNRVNGALHVL